MEGGKRGEGKELKTESYMSRVAVNMVPVDAANLKPNNQHQ